MAEMESEMSSMNEDNPDPRQLGRLMRKMTEATGQKMDAMEQMIQRWSAARIRRNSRKNLAIPLKISVRNLARGQPPTIRRAPIKLRRGRPQRDPALYEMKDYL